MILYKRACAHTHTEQYIHMFVAKKKFENNTFTVENASQILYFTSFFKLLNLSFYTLMITTHNLKIPI